MPLLPLSEVPLIIPPSSLHPLFCCFLVVSESRFLGFSLWAVLGFVVLGEFVGKCCSLGCHVLCIRREVLCAIFTSVLRLLNSCICVTTSIFELEAHARDPSCNTNFEPQAIQLANPSPHGCFVVRVVLLGPSWHSSQSIRGQAWCSIVCGQGFS